MAPVDAASKERAPSQASGAIAGLACRSIAGNALCPHESAAPNLERRSDPATPMRAIPRQKFFQLRSLRLLAGSERSRDAKHSQPKTLHTNGWLLGTNKPAMAPVDAVSKERAPSQASGAIAGL